MRPKFKTRSPKKFYRLNYFIQAKELRLLDESGKQIGVMTKEEALKKARELQIDVVEIAPKANPPVAKLIDFKKFKYLESKKERQEKKSQKSSGVKEIRLRPFIGEHDFNVRVDQGQGFLDDGNQLKISLPFRGREITRQFLGHEVINKFLASLTDFKVVRPAHMEGKVLVTMLAPDKKNKNVNIKMEN